MFNTGAALVDLPGRPDWMPIASDVIPPHSEEFSQYSMFSADFHIGPIADVKKESSRFGVSVIDKSLSMHCHLTNTCADDLRILSKTNGT